MLTLPPEDQKRAPSTHAVRFGGPLWALAPDTESARADAPVSSEPRTDGWIGGTQVSNMSKLGKRYWNPEIV